VPIVTGTLAHAYCYSVVCRWRKRQREASLRPPRLQPLPLGSLLGPTWMAEVALPNGATLRFSAQASAAWAKDLLLTLSR
jgi:hypothetical protein